jgi:hypothetical protein
MALWACADTSSTEIHETWHARQTTTAATPIGKPLHLSSPKS